ncbi:MAG: glycoside hydrolase family 16 protein [Acidimicrobiaceae bacterium]|nr:glycoside hydrolase family 16 protein [Acidimicrobiaceae bacterium]
MESKNATLEKLTMPRSQSAWNEIIAFISIVFALGAVASVLVYSLKSPASIPRAFNKQYPIGVPNVSNPSGMAPMGPRAMPGYRRSYVNEFNGSTLPKGWYVFTGIPGGSPGGQFAANHVVVHHGLLQLNTWRDPLYQRRWVTGGLCQCDFVQTYGAYFVRSRVTGGGASAIELLWPESNVWPPEIDFNESGGSTNSSSSTVHWGPTNQIDQRSVPIDLTKWHTWGVVWSPNSIDYLVDGRAWAVITNKVEIPHIPMRLDIEQRTMCQSGFQCPRVPVSMLIDWVAEFSPS